MNLYAHKLINNCNKISEFYQTLIGMNQITLSAHEAEGGNNAPASGRKVTMIGNTSILDEGNLKKSQFKGLFGKEIPNDDVDENDLLSLRNKSKQN